jgi:hypothetical protein
MIPGMIQHTWKTSRNLPASVSCSGPDLQTPGAITIDIPEDPLQSERMTMALEILRLWLAGDYAVKDRDRIIIGLEDRIRELMLENHSKLPSR